MGTFCVPTVQYDSQEIDIGPMCAYSSMPYVDLCDHHLNKDTQMLQGQGLPGATSS